MYWFTFFVFSRNYFYLVGRSTLWSFLQRLVYTLVVTGFVQIEICLNVYVDTGTSHKYVTLCLCAPKRKRKRVLGRKREKLLWYERTVLERRLHCKFNSGFKLSLLKNVYTAVNGTIMKYIRGRRTLDRQKMDIPSVFFVYKTLVMSLKIEVWWESYLHGVFIFSLLSFKCYILHLIDYSCIMSLDMLGKIHHHK